MYINIWIEQQDKMPSKAPFQYGCVIWIITSWWNFKNAVLLLKQDPKVVI